MSQLPNLFGVAGGGHNFFEPRDPFAGLKSRLHLLILTIGATAMLALLLGDTILPGRPVGLTVVAVAILWQPYSGSDAGIPVRKHPGRDCRPSRYRVRDLEFESYFPSRGCLLLAYIEGVSRAQFCCKHGYSLDVGRISRLGR